MSTELVKTNGHSNGIALAGAMTNAERIAKATAPRPVTERDLDKAIADIETYKRDVFLNGWRLGKKLAEVHERLAWKQRLGEDEKPLYASFGDFCKAELKLTKQEAYKFIRISTEFSESDALRLGSAKMSLLLQAAKLGPKARAVVAKVVDGGGSKADAAAKIRELKFAAGVDRLGNKAESEKPEKVKPAKVKVKATVEEITIASLIGKKHKLEAFALAKVKGEYVSAKTLEDKPWARLQMSNDVQLVFAASQGTNGKVYFHVEAKRITDT